MLAAAAVFGGSTQRLDAGEYALSDIPEGGSLPAPAADIRRCRGDGVVNVATDQAGTPRFVPMVFTDGDRVEASFALRAAALAAGEDPKIEADGVSIGGRFVATDLGHALPLAFYGPHGSIRTISAAAVLNGRALAERHNRPHRGDRRHGDRCRRRLPVAVRSGAARRRGDVDGNLPTWPAATA